MMNNRIYPALKGLFLLLLTMLPAGVQADACYKNFHVKLDAVPTGAGQVYIDYVIDASNYPYVTITTPPTESVDENITVQGANYYACTLLADPAPGWELAGFTTELKDEYAPEDFLGTASPTEAKLGVFNPLYVFDAQSYEAAQEVGWDHADTLQYYALFRPAGEQGIREVESNQKSCQPYRLNGVKAQNGKGIVIVNRKMVVRK